LYVRTRGGEEDGPEGEPLALMEVGIVRVITQPNAINKRMSVHKIVESNKLK
jgi:hypothetical protein